MIRSQASAIISRPAADVFEYVATDFFQNYQHWSPEVISLQATTDGPVGLGARGRQVRIDMGVRSECSFRVSVFEPARRVDFQCTSTPMLSSYRIDELGNGARLTFVFEYSGSSFLLRPFRRYIHSTVQRGAQQVVSNIKGLVESGVISSFNHQ
ncbi:MAG: SRPBCC family protein [Pseudomonadota bacterium]